MFGLLRALLGAQVFSAQMGKVRREARQAVTRIALGVVAALLTIVAVGFFTAAGHTTLHRILGPVSASLIVGGVYLALALIMWLAAALSGRREEALAPAPAADLAAAAQSALYGIGQSVGDAARKIDPQAVATEGGRRLARTVGPLTLAGAAVLAGYILARRVDR